MSKLPKASRDFLVMINKSDNQNGYTILASIGTGLFAGLMAMSWVALLLGEFGIFNPLLPIVLFVLSFIVIFHVRHHGQPRPFFSRRCWPAVAVFAFACLSMCWVLPPSEMILGGWDPGVYVHTASNLVHNHSFLVDMPDLAELDPDEKELLTRALNDVIREPFGGMRILENGLVSPQFFHLYPSLMAVAWAVGGLWAALSINPLLYAGSLCGIFALASRLSGHYACGLAAAVVLAFNPAQIWMAKFSTAELLTQFLLIGGFVMALKAMEPEEKSRWPAILAGCAFGLAFMTRFDALLILLPLCVLCIGQVGSSSMRHRMLAILGVTVLLMFHAWLHKIFVAKLYPPIEPNMHSLLGWSGLLLLMGILGLFVLSGKNIQLLTEKYGRHWRLFLCSGFIVWATGAWFIRPRLNKESGYLRNLLEDLFPWLTNTDFYSFLVGYDAINFLFLSNIMTPWGLFFSLAGIALMVLHIRGIWERIWLISSILVFIIVLTWIFNEHFMMWITRRFIPVIIPLLSIGLVMAGFYVLKKLTTNSLIFFAGVFILPVLILTINHSSTFAMMKHREWPGLIFWADNVAKKLPEKSFLFCDQPGFAAPFRFIYGIKAYEILPTKNTKKIFELMKKRALNFETYFLTMYHEGITENSFIHVAEFPLKSHILETPKTSVPLKTKGRSGHFSLYKVIP